MRVKQLSETLKILKRFAACSLLCLCVTAMVCGAAMVDTNTRRLALNEPGRQVGLHFDQKTTTFFMTGGDNIDLPPLAPIGKALRYATAQLGSLAAIVGEVLKIIP